MQRLMTKYWFLDVMKGWRHWKVKIKALNYINFTEKRLVYEKPIPHGW